MIRSIRLSLALVALAAALSVSSSVFAQSKSNGIAAVVNGQVITESQVREAVTAQQQMLQMQMRDDPVALEAAMKELEDGALDNLIDRELILAEFRKIGGSIKAQYVEDDINTIIRESFKEDRDAFVTELARSGMTMKKFRDMREKMIIVQVMRGRYASEQTPPTPAEVHEFYQKNIDQFRDNDMIKISTITVPKFTGDSSVTLESQKRLAEDIRSKVVAGADFAATARTYSQDSRAEDGGEWPWMDRKQMKKSIADSAFAVPEGGVSQVVVDEAAYILIAVDAKKLGKAEPLDSVRPQIERIIRQEKAKESLDAWLESLRRKAVIKRYD